MMNALASLRSAASVVSVIPEWSAARNSSSDTSPTGDRPAASASSFSMLISNPMVAMPRDWAFTANGSPT